MNDNRDNPAEGAANRRTPADEHVQIDPALERALSELSSYDGPPTRLWQQAIDSTRHEDQRRQWVWVRRPIPAVAAATLLVLVGVVVVNRPQAGVERPAALKMGATGSSTSNVAVLDRAKKFGLGGTEGGESRLMSEGKSGSRELTRGVDVAGGGVVPPSGMEAPAPSAPSVASPAAPAGSPVVAGPPTVLAGAGPHSPTPKPSALAPVEAARSSTPRPTALAGAHAKGEPITQQTQVGQSIHTPSRHEAAAPATSGAGTPVLARARIVGNAAADVDNAAADVLDAKRGESLQRFVGGEATGTWSDPKGQAPDGARGGVHAPGGWTTYWLEVQPDRVGQVVDGLRKQGLNIEFEEHGAENIAAMAKFRQQVDLIKSKESQPGSGGLRETTRADSDGQAERRALEIAKKSEHSFARLIDERGLTRLELRLQPSDAPGPPAGDDKSQSRRANGGESPRGRPWLWLWASGAGALAIGAWWALRRAGASEPPPAL